MLVLFIVAVILVVWTAWRANDELFTDERKKAAQNQLHSPWESVLEPEEIEEIFSDRYPLCVNCVHPESAPIWICEKCGCPTGHYTPYMPYLKIYWTGWLFRSGVDGSVKLTPLRWTGFILSWLLNYGFFFPLYLYRLIRSYNGKHIVEKRNDIKSGDKGTQ